MTNPVRLGSQMATKYVLCPDWPVPVVRGTPGTIAGCGRMTPDDRDDEGWVDCQHCGLGFNPDHVENRPPRDEKCITCGRALTGDDPVTTTLGPRCAKHF